MKEGSIDTRGMKEGPILDELDNTITPKPSDKVVHKPESPSPPGPPSTPESSHNPEHPPTETPKTADLPEKKSHKKKVPWIEGFEDYELSGPTFVLVKKQAMLSALGESMGHIGNACKKANISRRTHQSWKELDPAYKRAYKDNLEYMKDEFEYLLKKKAYSSDTQAIKFFLERKAKDRGYTETRKTINEHSGEIKNPQGINFILQSDPNYDEEKRRNKPPAPQDKEETPQMPIPDVPEPAKPNDTSHS